eukprot:TRINITY_DN2412_c0_g1_i1.p1 TRINITY_DN2412_c0_g1~~TRINITY_DN2412_c0_g1_i1.p1  ORF type:complete len:1363 (+),score=404.31 TRINITY_DN2412_c0_g1_i1:58-4146(+)
MKKGKSSKGGKKREERVSLPHAELKDSAFGLSFRSDVHGHRESVVSFRDDVRDDEREESSPEPSSPTRNRGPSFSTFPGTLMVLSPPTQEPKRARTSVAPSSRSGSAGNLQQRPRYSQCASPEEEIGRLRFHLEHLTEQMHEAVAKQVQMKSLLTRKDAALAMSMGKLQASERRHATAIADRAVRLESVTIERDKALRDVEEAKKEAKKAYEEISYRVQQRVCGFMRSLRQYARSDDITVRKIQEYVHVLEFQCAEDLGVQASAFETEEAVELERARQRLDVCMAEKGRTENLLRESEFNKRLLEGRLSVAEERVGHLESEIDKMVPVAGVLRLADIAKQVIGVCRELGPDVKDMLSSLFSQVAVSVEAQVTEYVQAVYDHFAEAASIIEGLQRQLAVAQNNAKGFAVVALDHGEAMYGELSRRSLSALNDVKETIDSFRASNPTPVSPELLDESMMSQQDSDSSEAPDADAFEAARPFLLPPTAAGRRRSKKLQRAARRSTRGRTKSTLSVLSMSRGRAPSVSPTEAAQSLSIELPELLAGGERGEQLMKAVLAAQLAAVRELGDACDVTANSLLWEEQKSAKLKSKLEDTEEEVARLKEDAAEAKERTATAKKQHALALAALRACEERVASRDEELARTSAELQTTRASLEETRAAAEFGKTEEMRRLEQEAEDGKGQMEQMRSRLKRLQGIVSDQKALLSAKDRRKSAGLGASAAGAEDGSGASGIALSLFHTLSGLLQSGWEPGEAPAQGDFAENGAFVAAFCKYLMASAGELGRMADPDLAFAAGPVPTRSHKAVQCGLLSRPPVPAGVVSAVALAAAAASAAISVGIPPRWKQRYAMLGGRKLSELEQLSRLLNVEYRAAKAARNATLAITVAAKIKSLEEMVGSRGAALLSPRQSAAARRQGSARSGIAYSHTLPSSMIFYSGSNGSPRFVAGLSGPPEPDDERSGAFAPLPGTTPRKGKRKQAGPPSATPAADALPAAAVGLALVRGGSAASKRPGRPHTSPGPQQESVVSAPQRAATPDVPAGVDERLQPPPSSFQRPPPARVAGKVGPAGWQGSLPAVPHPDDRPATAKEGERIAGLGPEAAESPTRPTGSASGRAQQRRGPAALRDSDFPPPPASPPPASPDSPAPPVPLLRLQQIRRVGSAHRPAVPGQDYTLVGLDPIPSITPLLVPESPAPAVATPADRLVRKSPERLHRVTPATPPTKAKPPSDSTLELCGGAAPGAVEVCQQLYKQRQAQLHSMRQRQERIAENQKLQQQQLRTPHAELAQSVSPEPPKRSPSRRPKEVAVGHVGPTLGGWETESAGCAELPRSHEHTPVGARRRRSNRPKQPQPDVEWNASMALAEGPMPGTLHF